MTDAGRPHLRARVFLRAVLPLVETIAAARPRPLLMRRASAALQIEVDGSDLGAALVWRDGAVTVEQGIRTGATARCAFRSPAALGEFFAGKLALPRIVGLRHPLVLASAAGLLASLRILQPGPPPTAAAERALRVELLLRLVTRGLAELHRGGHAEMTDLVHHSPERIYQWTVGSSDIAAYLRMDRGQVKAGRGRYLRRQPFVAFHFADVDAALAVLTATGSQMSGVKSGRVETSGSPEYTRKIALMMQKVDELLMEG